MSEYTNQDEVENLRNVSEADNFLFHSDGKHYLCINKLFFRKVSHSIAIPVMGKEESPGSKVHPALRIAGDLSG